MVLLLQWNAMSLMANGQEFKKYIDDLSNKPDIRLRPNLEFRLDGYASVRCDREDGAGGGCATFIGNDISFRELSVGGKEQEQEYVIVVIWMNEGECVIINYYNPCRKLELGQITQIVGLGSNKVVVCGDFNAHST